MKTIIVKLSRAEKGGFWVGDDFYRFCDTFEEAYTYASNDLIAAGDEDHVNYMEDQFVERNFGEDYQKAHEEGTLGELFEDVFANKMTEELYKTLLEDLDASPEIIDFEEEVKGYISDKERKSSYWGDGLKVMAEYLEALDMKEAVEVVAYYHLKFGFGEGQEQLLSDIENDCVESIEYF